MKAKFSLKKIKFKELFLQHVEKGILAATGVCLLLFIISALQRETLPEEKQPDRLALQTQNAKAHVEKGTFNEKDVQPDGEPGYAGRVRRDPVLLATYDSTVPLNGPIISSRNKRGEPGYLTVTDLRVAAGFSPFVTIDPNAVDTGPKRIRNRGQEVIQEEKVTITDDRRRGGVRPSRDSILVIKYWTVVTALVPVRKQKAEYFSVLEEAVGFDPEQDLPRYRGFQVERAEVTSGDLNNLKWAPIKSDTKFMEVWAEPAAETVMADYVTNMFAAPLGPRTGSDWGDEAGHLPEIAFEPKRGMGGQFPGGRGGVGPMGGEGFDPGFQGRAGGMEGGFAEEEEEEGAEIFERGVPKKKVQRQEDPAEARRRSEQLGYIGEKPVKGVDHLLFRFADYSVKPGKQYVYRVRLGLTNPNASVLVKNLQRPELSEGAIRTTAWSDPTPVATVPYGDKMLAGKVTPAATAVSEPRGVIRIVQVNETLGAEVPLEKEVSRGTLANFPDQAFEYIDLIKQQLEEGTGDFLTNAVVLDMRGGRPVFGPRDKELTEPGEILVMSRTGELLAMNEFDDEDVWKNYIPPEDPKRNADMMEGDYGMPPGEGINPRQTPGRPPVGRPGAVPKAGRTQPQPFDPLNGPVSSPTGPRKTRKPK